MRLCAFLIYVAQCLAQWTTDGEDETVTRTVTITMRRSSDQPTCTSMLPQKQLVSSLPSTISYKPQSSDQTPSYMTVVNKYRTIIGVSPLQYDSTLETGVQRTCDAGQGQMIHHFYDDARGQVLAPGAEEDFETVFVQGWLCERKDLPGIAKYCKDQYNFENQTGHADILSNPEFSKIGCAWAHGIWGCDIA